MTGAAYSPGPEFERFLYASVGEDHNGYAVTVLSTLARLGLDPWREAADLAALGREGARTRLERLLSGFRDVPKLTSDHGSVAQGLTLLLPEHPSLGATKLGGSVAAAGSPVTKRSILAVLMIILILAQGGRRHRGRGTGDAGRQQAARRIEGGGRQGTGLRGSP